MSLHRRDRKVKDREADTISPLYNHKGEPRYRDHGSSGRSQFFTIQELEDERRKRGNVSPDIVSPILSSKSTKFGSTKGVQRLPEDPSATKNPGSRMYIGIDYNGKKVMSKMERPIHLAPGEKIDPTGITTKSSCPASGGRSRALSRSDATKRRTSPFAGSKPGFERARNVPLEPLRSRLPALKTSDSSTRRRPLAPGANARLEGITRGGSVSSQQSQMSRCSRFTEDL